MVYQLNYRHKVRWYQWAALNYYLAKIDIVMDGEITMDINMEYDIWIEVIAMSSDYFNKWYKGDPFLLNVGRDEVRLYGAA